MGKVTTINFAKGYHPQDDHFIEFSKQILDSWDVDPVYPVLKKYFEMENYSLEEKLFGVHVYLTYYNVFWTIATLKALRGNFNFESWRQLEFVQNKTAKFGSDRRGIRAYGLNVVLPMFSSFFKDYTTQEEYYIKPLTNDKRKNYEINKDLVLAVPHNGSWAAYKHIDLLTHSADVPIECTDWWVKGRAFGGKQLVVDWELGGGKLGKVVKETPEVVARINDFADRWTAKFQEVIDPTITYDKSETCACKYHALYGRTYYAGHDIDKMQEEIMKSGYFDKEIADLMYHLREECFDKKHLGEHSGWEGVRKELKGTLTFNSNTVVSKPKKKEGEPEVNEHNMNRRLLELEMRIVELEEKLAAIEEEREFEEPIFDGLFHRQPEPDKDNLDIVPDSEATVKKEEPKKGETPETEGKSISKLVAEQLARESEDDDSDEEDEPEVKPSLLDFVTGHLNDEEDDDEESDEDDEESDSEPAPQPKPATRSFSSLMDEEEEPEAKPEEEEEVRKPIKSETAKENIFIAAPYGGNRVDKTLGDKIRAVANEIGEVYMPLEPFHYREVKRHGTQYVLEACVEKQLPISLETRRVIPEWAVEMLSQMDSEVRIHLNTLDKKTWRALYPTKKAADPEELVQTFADCYNAGIQTILKISPIVPGIISKKDVLEVVDRLKNWTPVVEICFAVFTTEELAELKGKMNHDDFYAIKEHYVEYEGTDRWYVKDDYREQFLQLLHSFVTGSKIEFKILNEAKFDGESVSTIKF